METEEQMKQGTEEQMKQGTEEQKIRKMVEQMKRGTMINYETVRKRNIKT